MKQKVKESIFPLTIFRRQSTEVIKKLKESGAPIILTQNGYAAAVLLEPDAYHDLLNLAEQAHNAEIGAAIERSRNAATQGKVRDHEAVMDDLNQWLSK